MKGWKIETVLCSSNIWVDPPRKKYTFISFKKNSKTIQILQKNKRFDTVYKFCSFIVVVKEWIVERFNLYCVLQIFDSSHRKYTFISEKYIKPFRSHRTTKDATQSNNFVACLQRVKGSKIQPLLCSSNIWPTSQKIYIHRFKKIQKPFKSYRRTKAPAQSKNFVALLSSSKSERYKDWTFIVFFKYLIHIAENIHSSV